MPEIYALSAPSTLRICRILAENGDIFDAPVGRFTPVFRLSPIQRTNNFWFGVLTRMANAWLELPAPTPKYVVFRYGLVMVPGNEVYAFSKFGTLMDNCPFNIDMSDRTVECIKIGHILKVLHTKENK